MPRPSRWSGLSSRGAASAHSTLKPSIDVGTPEDWLQGDGTPQDSEVPLGDGDLRLRLMGAGEEMELVGQVEAGTELVLETTLEAVTPKETRAGTCVFVTTVNTFMSAEHAVLNRNRRTVVLRNPKQEP